MSRGQSIHEASKRTLDFGAENLNGHVSCWRFQDRVGQTSCSSDAWLTSGFAIRDHEPASITCTAFQSVPQPRIPFKAKMHVNAIQQLFRPSFCFRAFCCHWTLSVTVVSLDFSSSGFCCFSCVAHLTSFLRILKFGVATRGLGTSATSNSLDVPRQRMDLSENAKHAPAKHLAISSLCFFHATPPNVHGQ